MPAELSRTVTITEARLRPWIDNFSLRHGLPLTSLGVAGVRFASPDGAEAVITVPFPPLLVVGEDLISSLLQHVVTERRVGAILVRKGGFAVGVFDGSRLVASKVGSSYVQGTTKAGGWSQQRYARRRANQAKSAYADAADEVVTVLVPQLAGLEAVVTGGDRPAVAAVLADPRLTKVRPLVRDPVYPVPDPRLRVLAAFPEQFRSLTIRLNALA